MSSPQGVIGIAPGYRLQWEEAQQAHVLLYPEGMIVLNPSAGEILKQCDGTRDGEAIIAGLERRFPDTDLAADVREFLGEAHGKGWIRGR